MYESDMYNEDTVTFPRYPLQSCPHSPYRSGVLKRSGKPIHDNFDNEVFQVPYIDYSTKEKKKISQDIINRAEDIGADVIISNFVINQFILMQKLLNHIFLL